MWERYRTGPRLVGGRLNIESGSREEAVHGDR